MSGPQPFRGIKRERLERACRIYNSTKEAAQALGINPVSLSRLCRKMGIETPSARQRRQHQAAQ